MAAKHPNPFAIPVAQLDRAFAEADREVKSRPFRADLKIFFSLHPEQVQDFDETWEATRQRWVIAREDVVAANPADEREAQAVRAILAAVGYSLLILEAQREEIHGAALRIREKSKRFQVPPAPRGADQREVTAPRTR
jgi:hypothetical protein